MRDTDGSNAAPPAAATADDGAEPNTETGGGKMFFTTSDLIARINQSVASFNEELVSGALVPEDSVLDIRGSLGGNSSIAPAFARDTLHLNSEGYEALAPAIIEAAASSSGVRN